MSPSSDDIRKVVSAVLLSYGIDDFNLEAELSTAIGKLLQEAPTARNLETQRLSTLKALGYSISREQRIRDEIHTAFGVRPNYEISVPWRSVIAFVVERPENETIAEFARWWYENDWRGQKGQAPTATQIQELWEQAFSPNSQGTLRMNDDGSFN